MMAEIMHSTPHQAFPKKYSKPTRWYQKTAWLYSDNTQLDFCVFAYLPNLFMSLPPLAATISFNHINTKKVLSSITSSRGKSLVLSAATRTSHWRRPESAVDAITAPLEAAVAANESIIPSNTAEIIAR